MNGSPALHRTAVRPIFLTASERERLKKMTYGHKTEHRLRQRAQVVLYAARGRSNARVARETGLHADTVGTWRDRFAGHRLPALSDRKHSGRPASFAPLQRAQVKALACHLPAESGTPLSRWRHVAQPRRCAPGVNYHRLSADEPGWVFDMLMSLENARRRVGQGPFRRVASDASMPRTRAMPRGDSWPRTARQHAADPHHASA